MISRKKQTLFMFDGNKTMIKPLIIKPPPLSSSSLLLFLLLLLLFSPPPPPPPLRCSVPLPSRSRWCVRSERGGTARCGSAAGGERRWPSKSSSPERRPAGSERRRSTRPSWWDTRTSWVGSAQTGWNIRTGRSSCEFEHEARKETWASDQLQMNFRAQFVLQLLHWHQKDLLTASEAPRESELWATDAVRRPQDQ